MTELPTGTVTFLFTDIEGSTRLLQELGPERYAEELERHHGLLRRAFAEHGGVEMDTEGDAFFVAFTQAQDAVDAAQRAQLALADGPVAVRMGLHTGAPLIWAEGYVGVDVHRAARICAAAHGGQIVLSEATRGLVEALVLDLGLHRLKDLSEPRRLFQLGAGEFPPLRTLHATNLPVQTSPLVGRARELAEAGDILAEHRLLTLTGPGGSGKTRLALQLAADVVEAYPDGVFWISLQAVREPELVLPAIGSALGAKDGLSDFIADRRLLLLLDNLEQVVDAAPLLAEVIGETPSFKLLATSREPLRITGERRYPVEPLPEQDAVSLFLERAVAVNATFEPTEAVAEICRRLDGLPLALELAASRVAVLDPDALLERLERSLPVLTHGARDAPERQRTLRAAIEWSYDLLDGDEQENFARLAVFTGSFDAESAEEVCGVGLDALQSLLEKSLVRRWGSGRFGMLETIHEFATERLSESADENELRTRHAAHLIELADAALPELRGERVGLWLDRFEAERENFRAALRWSADAGRADLTCLLAAGFGFFWLMRGPHAEARRWMEATLPKSDVLAPEQRASFLYWAGLVAAENHEYERASSLYEQALALYREVGDVEGAGFVLISMGTLAYATRRLDDAERLWEESADLFRRLGTGWGLPGIAMNIGNIAAERGDFERAERLYREGLAAYRRLDSRHNIVISLMNLAQLEVERGSPAGAPELLREAAEIAVEIGSRAGLAHVLIVYTHAAVAEMTWERAAVLTGAADRLLEEVGSKLFPEDEQKRSRLREAVEAELGAAAFAEACAKGAAMDLDEAVRYATG